MRSRHAAAATILAGLLVMTAACGQKGGVHLASGTGATGAAGSFGAGDASGATSGADGSGTAGGAQAGDATGAASGAPGSATGGATAGTSGGAAGSAPGAAGGATGGSTAPGAATPGAAKPAGPGDRTGVTDGEIRIGIHAPATGAGAPAPSFDMGKAVYTNFLNSKGGINGRKVTIFFEDDGYNPSSAVAACKKLVEQDKVFLLIGGGGTDQIVACAQYASSIGVPYLAEGVTEKGLSNLTNYFAESLTYKAQGALLAQYIAHTLGKKDVAMVRGDTANFDDAHTGFVTAAQQLGLNIKSDIRTNKDGNTASTDAGTVCSAIGGPTGSGNAVVYPLMSPKAFINFASAAAQQQCFPRYAGIGITLGLNIVAQTLCQGGAASPFKGGASFFSPYPGLDKADAVDADYQKQYAAQNNGRAGDDIGLGLWGAEKLLAAELAAPGKDLSRQSFLAALPGKTFDTGLYPKITYASSRFGGTATHVLIANCQKGAYDTEALNKSGF